MTIEQRADRDGVFLVESLLQSQSNRVAGIHLRSLVDRAELLETSGTAIFEPMAGRPMKEYVSFPAEWRDEPERMTPWIERSVTYVEGLPPKKR